MCSNWTLLIRFQVNKFLLVGDCHGTGDFVILLSNEQPLHNQVYRGQCIETLQIVVPFRTKQHIFGPLKSPHITLLFLFHFSHFPIFHSFAPYRKGQYTFYLLKLRWVMIQLQMNSRFNITTACLNLAFAHFAFRIAHFFNKTPWFLGICWPIERIESRAMAEYFKRNLDIKNKHDKSQNQNIYSYLFDCIIYSNKLIIISYSICWECFVLFRIALLNRLQMYITPRNKSAYTQYSGNNVFHLLVTSINVFPSI